MIWARLVDCVTEAAAALKMGVYIERYVEQPRHIEIQVWVTSMENAFISANENVRFNGVTRN
jgi:acetyl/propionyl-CoA carboxylase alpha subunit